MDSDQNDLDALLQKAEMELQNNPQQYKNRLLQYSLLGYGVILIITAILLGLVSVSVVLALSSTMFLLLLLKKKLIFPLLVFAWVLFKSIFVWAQKPHGIKITKTQSPELFACIETLTTELCCPKIHQVIITPEFNAALAQTPRGFALGFTHNTLILGFELLMSLNADELKSVIAHELAHLSGNHSKFHGWIYRTRENFQNILFNLEQHNSWTTAPIRKFFKWYSPRFAAYSFALARLNEYEADAQAARLTSAHTLASALIKTSAYKDFILSKHWTPFNLTIMDTPTPMQLPYAGLVSFLQQNRLTVQEANDAISFSKKETTSYLDTHPCLTDRLSALSEQNMQFSPTAESAGRYFFGDGINQMAELIDREWEALNAKSWQEKYEQIQQEKCLLHTLQNKDQVTLNQQDSWSLATLSEKFTPEQPALPLYQAYLQKFPDDVACQFAIGRLLLAENNDMGLELLEKASAKHEFTEQAAHAAYTYLIMNNRADDANVWFNKLSHLEEVGYQASIERQIISIKDGFYTSEDLVESIQHLIVQIQSNKKVKAAWVMQKQVSYFTDSPVYVFVIEAKRGFYLADNLPEKIINALTLRDTETVIVLTKGQNRRLFNKIKKLGKKVI